MSLASTRSTVVQQKHVCHVQTVLFTGSVRGATFNGGTHVYQHELFLGSSHSFSRPPSPRYVRITRTVYPTVLGNPPGLLNFSYSLGQASARFPIQRISRSRGVSNGIIVDAPRYTCTDCPDCPDLMKTIRRPDVLMALTVGAADEQ